MLDPRVVILLKALCIAGTSSVLLKITMQLLGNP